VEKRAAGRTNSAGVEGTRALLNGLPALVIMWQWLQSRLRLGLFLLRLTFRSRRALRLRLPAARTPANASITAKMKRELRTAEGWSFIARPRHSMDLTPVNPLSGLKVPAIRDEGPLPPMVFWGRGLDRNGLP